MLKVLSRERIVVTFSLRKSNRLLGLHVPFLPLQQETRKLVPLVQVPNVLVQPFVESPSIKVLPTSPTFTLPATTVPTPGLAVTH